MATDNIIGIAMELDVTDLKAGLQETKKSITTANKEFAAATSGMDDWTKTSEGLNAKLKQLDTVLKNQKKNVAGYEAELKRLEDAGRGNSEEARRLRDKLLDAQAAVGKTEKAARKYRTQLENVEASTEDVTSETNAMTRALKKADDAAIDLKGGFSVLKGAMAGLVANGITALVGGIQSAVEESREFRTEMGYLEATAKDTGSSFDHVKEQLKEVTAITDDQGAAVEGLNNLMSAGFKGDALDEITDQLVGASIKWKDTLKFEGMADGLQETLATGKGAGTFIELLERSGIVAEDFDAALGKCNTTAEKQDYILQTLSKLGLNDVKVAYEEQNKSLIDANKASQNYNEAQAALGERAEPVLTSIKQGFADILNEILKLTSGADFEGLATSIKGAFQWFIETCLPAIKSGVKFVVDHQDIILALLGAIGAAYAAWKIVTIIQGIVAATKAWIVATEGMTIAQRLLNLAMKANPIGIVITLIAALVAAFIILWNKSDAFRKFWLNLWDNIKKYADIAVKAIVKFVTGAWDKIKKAWSGAKKWFSDVWNGIKNVFSNVTGWFKDKFSDAWNGIKSVWSNVGDWFKGIIDKIIGFFADLPGKMKDVGKDMIDGLINGIKSVGDKVKDAVSDVVMGPVNWVKDKLGINSPSTLMRDEIGKMMGAGVGEGLIASASDVVRKADTFSRRISAGLTDSVGTIAGGRASFGAAATSKNVVNNFTQVINAPKQPSKLELYRQSRNLLNLKGVY